MESTQTPLARKSPAFSILPHEWCFGAFLALTWLRLTLAGGAALGWSFVFLGCLLASVGVIAWARRNSNGLRWRVRLLFYPAAMGVCFYAMAKAVPLLGVPQRDDWLLAWDRALLGETPALAWVPLLRPWLVDVALGGGGEVKSSNPAQKGREPRVNNKTRAKALSKMGC